MTPGEGVLDVRIRSSPKGITMLKKIVAAGALACAALGVVPPAASAASAAPAASALAYTFYADFPDHASASFACYQGKVWRWWFDCEFQAYAGSEKVGLYVA
jgi:hypothetical protein